MPRKAIIDISEKSKQKIVDAITNALNNAEIDHISRGLNFKNGLGLFNLNYIFDELIKISDNDLIVSKFRRGCFESVFVYDMLSKTLITLTSTANIKRLIHRKEVIDPHYIDALLSINTDYEGDSEQTCMFEMNQDWQTERIDLCDTMLSAIKENNIQKYVICEYDIKHKSFSLVGLKCSLYSGNYAKLKEINLAEYLKPDYSIKSDSIIENIAEGKDPVKNLSIKIKSNISKKA